MQMEWKGVAMIRKLALFVILAAPVVFAQSTAPASPGNTVVMPGTNIYVVGGGLYGTGVYVVPGSTPGVAGVAAPGGVAGISLAGRAGISLEQPMQLGVQSTLAPSWPVTAYAGYNAPYTTGANGVSEAAAAESAAPTTGGPASDLGPAYAAGEPEAPAVSLAEVAAYYKANRPQHVRTYTNADAPPSAGIVKLPKSKSGEATPQPAMPPPQPLQPKPPRM
jgi:hypothetical protein